MGLPCFCLQAARNRRNRLTENWIILSLQKHARAALAAIFPSAAQGTNLSVDASTTLCCDALFLDTRASVLYKMNRKSERIPRSLLQGSSIRSPSIHLSNSGELP